MSKLAWGYVLVVLALLLWAGNAVIGRIAPDVNVPPLALNFWRWMVALLVLAPFAIPKLSAQRDLFRAHWRLWTVFGIVTIAGFNSAYYVGLQYTTVVQGTLISAVLPIFVLVAARVFLAQPITPKSPRRTMMATPMIEMATPASCRAGQWILLPFRSWPSSQGWRSLHRSTSSKRSVDGRCR